MRIREDVPVKVAIRTRVIPPLTRIFNEIRLFITFEMDFTI